MTTDRSGQEGPSAEQIAASDRDAAQPSPATTISSDAAANAAARLLLDAAQQHAGHRPPLRPELGAHEPFFADLPQAVPAGAGEAPPLQTAAGPGPAAGGGGSRYDSDFGQLIAGLQSSGGDGLPGGTSTPGSGFAAALADDDGGPAPFARTIVPAAVPGAPADDDFADDGADTGSGGGDTSGGGDDTSSGGDDTGSGGDDTGAGGDDTGSGGDDDDGPGNVDEDAELPDLFTVNADTVDFNDVTAGSYRDGSQYDAGNQNDVVILPGDAAKAAAAGFTPGTLFLAGNGDDTVTGGGLADLIDGGTGQDLLAGGAGDDTLIGGNGNDTLVGGLGDDVMTGGNGKDVFRFSLSADEGDDMILDFKTGKGGDTLQFADVVDVTGDGKLTIADLDAVGSVSGTADAIVITFDSGASITLAGLDGSGIDSFADLVSKAKVTVEIL